MVTSSINFKDQISNLKEDWGCGKEFTAETQRSERDAEEDGSGGLDPTDQSDQTDPTDLLAQVFNTENHGGGVDAV